MLPCQSKCSRYFEGCHKSCARWELMCKANQISQKRKKAYLAYHNERCGDIIRRCYQNVAYLPHR